MNVITFFVGWSMPVKIVLDWTALPFFCVQLSRHHKYISTQLDKGNNAIKTKMSKLCISAEVVKNEYYMNCKVPSNVSLFDQYILNSYVGFK